MHYRHSETMRLIRSIPDFGIRFRMVMYISRYVKPITGFMMIYLKLLNITLKKQERLQEEHTIYLTITEILMQKMLLLQWVLFPVLQKKPLTIYPVKVKR